MLADRINAGNLQTKGLQEKMGRGSREREEPHPRRAPLTSTTQRNGGRDAQRALLRQGFSRKGIA